MFVNPSAGAGRAGRKAAVVAAAFRQRNFAVQISETRSAEDLRRQASEAITRGFTTLIAMGGDGTLQALAQPAVGNAVTLGVIPAGGGNDFAAALGIPGDLTRAVEIIVRGESRAVDLMCVRAQAATTPDGAVPGKTTAYYLGGGGVGLDAEAVQLANVRFAHWPGRLRYVASALAALRKFSGAEVRVDLVAPQPAIIEKRLLLAALLNTPSFGGGLRVAPDARMDDGLGEVVLLETLRRWEVAALLPRLLWSGELRTRRATRLRASRIKIAASVPIKFQGDGEILCATPLEIEVLPGALRILAPAMQNS